MSFWSLQFLPKNEQKQFDLRYHKLQPSLVVFQVEFFRLFFGRIEDIKKGISELTDFVSRRCFCLKSSYFPSFNRGRISWSKEKGFLCGNVRHLYFQFCNRKCLLYCSPNVFTKKDKKTNFKLSLFSHNSNHLTTGFWGKEAWRPPPKWNTRFSLHFLKELS